MKVQIIDVNQVKKSFKEGSSTLNVLKGISGIFEQGHTYAITGVSGSGKSTLMHILAGLDTPDTGTVCFNGENINSFTPQQRSLFLNKTLGLVFQLPYLIRELTVIENVMLKGIISGRKSTLSQEWAISLLKMVNLEDKAFHAPLTLSGGQQQRVALVRALFTKPAFLLADEPTGNLDAATGKKIVDLIIHFQQEYGLGVVISSHDPYVAQTMQEVWRLDSGLLKKI